MFESTRGLLLGTLTLVVFATLMRLIVHFVGKHQFNPLTNPTELALTGIAAVVLLALTASFITSLFVIAAVLSANYLKFFFLREGIMPSDFGLLAETWQGAGSDFRVVATLVMLTALALALVLSNTRRWRGRLAILALAGVGAFAAHQQAAAVKSAMFPGDYERYWQPGSEFQERGFFTAFAMAALNAKVLAEEIERLPLMEQSAPHDLRSLALDLPRQPADLHIVLLESFIAPEDMTKLVHNPLPGAEETRSIARGPLSYAYSPTTGGKTARAEFEVLCGLPDFEMLGSITFNQLGGSRVDCLPSLLSRLGYRSAASQALPASFFSMGTAYRSLGFDDLRFEHSFDMSDKDGIWLSNASALKQNIAFLQTHVATRNAQPIFNYVVLAGGHHPFERDETRRPNLVTTEPEDETAARIVNHSLHTLDALAEWLDGVRALERPTVVVLFSDHLPPVSSDFLDLVGYRGFSELLPITGRRTYLSVMKDFEPIAQPNLAMWEIPYVTAGLLGDKGIPPHPARGRLMLVNGQPYDRVDPGKPLCTHTSNDACEASRAETERMRSAYLDLVKRSHIPDNSNEITSALIGR